MKRYVFALLNLTSLLTLAACAPYQPGSSGLHGSVCNELNSRIIFNGNTSDTRKAEIESAELPLYQRTYDKNCS